MKAVSRILAFLFLPVFSMHNVNAQNESHKDSLLIYLNSIHSKADSVYLPDVFDWISIAPEEILLKDDVMKQIYRLKNIINEADYFDLANSYIGHLVVINTREASEKAIAAGREFFEHYTGKESRYGHFGYLTVLREIRHSFRNLGKLNESIEFYSKIEREYVEKNDSDVVSVANNVLSGSYARLGIMERAYYHQRKSISYLNDSQSDLKIHWSAVLYGLAGKVNRYAVLGYYYLTDNRLRDADTALRLALKYYHQLDSAMVQSDVPFLFLQIAVSKTMAGAANSQAYYDTALFYLEKYKSPQPVYATYYQERGVDYSRLGLLDSAVQYFRKTRQVMDSLHLPVSLPSGQLIPDYYEAEVAMKKKNYPAAIELLHRQLDKLQNLNLRPNTIQTLLLLAKAYAATENDREAYKTMQEVFVLKDKMAQDEKEARTLSFETEKKMQENDTAIMLLNAKNESNRKMKYYLIGIVSLLGLLAGALALFYQNKRKAGKDLSAQNRKLSHTLEQLKATQSQLIHSEKMASLGELTAGIAHEIQNPLNFVNNFSEVNTELIEEMKEELKAGRTAEATGLADDIKSNNEKIAFHGKRADSIVKGMLQHSRSGSGQKEETDINSLADECLRLSYHGMRAKDKSFNAKTETSFDGHLPKISVVSQDIGRVLLNLITNSFYAVMQKKKMAGESYNPVVSLTTAREGNNIKIIVRDNGGGIPSKVIEKIFQPFFTTKPTGEGTGLGLSMSYDIITKGHGGKLEVDTKEGEFAAFTIFLPV
ncbi:MAG: ATP-binding protein [Chitinophagaceae bacterium]